MRAHIPGRLTTPALRAVLKRWQQHLSAWAPEHVTSIAAGLAESGGWAQRVVAFELLAGRPDAFACVGVNRIEEWARSLADWGSVDLFGVTIAGPAWRE